MSVYFITGGSGFLGLNLLRRLLSENNFSKIFLLVRKGKSQNINERFDAIASQYLSAYPEDVLAKVETIDSDDFLKNSSDYIQRLSSVTCIIHMLSSISFTETLREISRINVDITGIILDFALSLPSLEIFIHTSTAFICGESNEKVVYENNLNHYNKFHNNYEKSKYLGECLAWEYKDKLPLAVIRPGVIIGNSLTGEVIRYNMIYPVIKLLSKESVSVIPTDNLASINLIPVDYVVDSIIRIAGNPESAGKAFHLVNEKNSRVQDLIHYTCKILNVREPAFKKSMIFDRYLKGYGCYLRYASPVYDISNTREIIPSYNVPEVDKDLLQVMIDYCRKDGYL